MLWRVVLLASWRLLGCGMAGVAAAGMVGISPVPASGLSLPFHQSANGANCAPL